MQQITIHTLGPSNTNCENAARYWNNSNNLGARIILHPSIEEAVEALKEADSSDILLACAVYPNLHHVVFQNLEWLNIKDSFVIPTMEMLLVAPNHIDLKKIQSVSTHPAPSSLVSGYKLEFALSNAVAAEKCAIGNTDAAITTRPAAEDHNLVTLKSYGEIPMCFTIHKKKVRD